MTKAALIAALADYPDDMQIRISDTTGNCVPVSTVEEIPFTDDANEGDSVKDNFMLIA